LKPSGLPPPRLNRPCTRGVERELHVVQLGPKYISTRSASACQTGLVVDDLDLAIAYVVDPVDFADHVGAIDLQANASRRERARRRMNCIR